MGGLCSGGTTRRIASQDKQTEELKQNKSNQSLICRFNNKNDEHSSLPVRFHSGELRFSFSKDLSSSALGVSSDDKVPKGSFLSFPGVEKAVDVLDALGSGMMNLNSSGFSTRKVAKRNIISILAFEVANTITRGANLMHSLSKENIRSIKEDIIPSKPVQYLVSTDSKVLLDLAASDKREELDVFCREVIRFGGLCKDPQWHNLDRFFARHNSENAVYRQQREVTEAKMEELMTLAHHTSDLYHELNAFNRVKQEYQQKIDEMKSSNLPRKGEHLMMLQGEVKQQKKIVSGLKKKSLWSKGLEEVIEKLVDIVVFIYQEITEAFQTGGRVNVEKAVGSSQRLGAAGLALHYANIINQIDNIASKPASLPPSARDTLYRGLPASVKAALPSRLRKFNPREELEVSQIKAKMEKILKWLTPVAENTLKAHQGFGWVGEWANASIEFDKMTKENGNVISLQTLYHADKEKMDLQILTLVTLVHRLISRVRTHRDHDLKMPPLQSSSKKILILHSSVKNFPSPYGLRLELKRRAEDC